MISTNKFQKYGTIDNFILKNIDELEVMYFFYDKLFISDRTFINFCHIVWHDLERFGF